MRAVWIVAVAAAMLGAGLTSSASAQDIRDLIRNEAEQSNLAKGFQALSIFNVTPGVSAAVFYVDDGLGGQNKISNYKFSPSRTFEPIYGIKPYVEASVGFLGFKADGTLVDSGRVNDYKFDINTVAALGGVGVEIDLFEGTVFRPIFLAGYSRIWDNSTVSGPDAQTFKEQGRGILFDAWLNTALIGGAAEVVHSGYLGPVTDINYGAKVRYDQYYANTFSASDSVLQGSSTFGVMTAAAQIDGPLWGMTLFDREVRWIGFATNTYLPGDTNDELRFSYFFEVGGGLELVDRTIIKGLEGVSARTSALFGDNVYGWTAGLALEF